MFRRRTSRVKTPPLPVDAGSPQLGEVPPVPPKALASRIDGTRVIRCTSLRLDGQPMGEFIAISPEGRVIVTACGLPEPWSLDERAYKAYSCYLEEPGSGNRIRMDMVRAGDKDWVAVKHFSADLEGYSRACVFASGDGVASEPILTGNFTET